MSTNNYVNLFIHEETVKRTKVLKYRSRVKKTDRLGRSYYKLEVTMTKEIKVKRLVYRDQRNGRFASKAAFLAEQEGEVLPQVWPSNPMGELPTTTVMSMEGIDADWKVKSELLEAAYDSQELAEWMEGFDASHPVGSKAEKRLPTSEARYNEVMEWLQFEQSWDHSILVVVETPEPRVLNNLAFQQARVKLLVRKGMSKEDAYNEVMA